MAILNCVKHGITYEKECPQCVYDNKWAFQSRPHNKTEEWDFRKLKDGELFRGVVYSVHGVKGGLRPTLSNFAYEMERKLAKNDDKTGWRHLPIEALFRLLMVEIEEFKIAHEFFDKEEARKELVDVANYCMILWDRLSMEEDKNSGVAK